MVGIDVVGVFPIQSGDRLVRRGAGEFGRGPDDDVFAIGFVPNGDDLDGLFRREEASAELGFGLTTKTVAHAEGKFFQFEHLN